MRLYETVINISHLEGEGVSSKTGHIPCHKTMLLLAGQETRVMCSTQILYGLDSGMADQQLFPGCGLVCLSPMTGL